MRWSRRGRPARPAQLGRQRICRASGSKRTPAAPGAAPRCTCTAVPAARARQPRTGQSPARWRVEPAWRHPRAVARRSAAPARCAADRRLHRSRRGPGRSPHRRQPGRRLPGRDPGCRHVRPGQGRAAQSRQQAWLRDADNKCRLGRHLVTQALSRCASGGGRAAVLVVIGRQPTPETPLCRRARDPGLPAAGAADARCARPGKTASRHSTASPYRAFPSCF